LDRRRVRSRTVHRDADVRFPARDTLDRVLVRCESQIHAVTVHARGAAVTRRVTVPALPRGDVEILVPDVTVLADPGSLRASIEGARVVAGVRSMLHVPEAPAIPGESVELVRALTGRLERLAAERERLAAHRSRLQAIDVKPRLAFAAAASRRPGHDVASRTADALAAAALVAEVQERVDARLREIDEAARELERQLEAARLADAQERSRARMGAGHPTRQVAVQLAGDGPVHALELSYVVPAARWWPTYTLRMTDDGRRASWVLEALVAQLSGEDWTGVGLSLSTADLVHDARLPELASRRLGRVQRPPARAYRPPPPGLELLFAGYDRAFAGAPRALPPSEELPASLPEAELASADDSLDQLVSRDDDEDTHPGAMDLAARTLSKKAAPPAFALPAPAASIGGGGPPTPVPAPRAAALAAPSRPRAPTPGRGVAAVTAVEPADAWLDFDRLSLAPIDDARRGRLVAAGPGPEAARAREAQSRVESLTPERVRDPLATRGLFDHRYDCAGAAEVPSDGLPHRVTIGLADAAPTLRWRAVPREAPEVYKEASLENPFPAPLLSGPVDVYVEGTLLATAAIDRVDRGGRLTVGMGVEERIRVARNARVEESTAGLMRGASVVETTVTIELASSLGMPARVEILDRIPVTDDKGLEITFEPQGARPEPYTQSERGLPLRRGLLWTLEVPAGKKAQLSYRYVMTFPARQELVGGPRRE
jgi:hypothetical protein